MKFIKKNKNVFLLFILFLYILINNNGIYCLNNKINGDLNIENDNSNIVNKDLNYSNIENSINSLIINLLEKELSIDNFVELRERVELHTWLWREIFGDGPYDNDTFKKSSFIYQNSKYLTGHYKILATLHQKLYPWLYRSRFYSFNNLFNSFNGQGIVIYTSNKNFKNALSTVDTLRNIINTNLPIEIFYIGDNLSEENQKKFLEYSNVYISDITKYFDNNLLNIKEWSVKPFAILASRFKEVILIDADTIYIRDPSILFEGEGYKETGTVFFRDRTLFPGPNSGSEWIKTWMVNSFPETERLHFRNEETFYEMESSTIVINKGKVLLGLLAVCKYNEHQIRNEVIYTKIHEDKETFWMGFDMAREHYNEISLPRIFIGEILIGTKGNPNTKQLWGHQGHMGPDGKILFWNDHIVKNKNIDEYKNHLLKFDGYVIENSKINWVNSEYMNINNQRVFSLSEEEKSIINQIINRKYEIQSNISEIHENRNELNVNIEEIINNNYNKMNFIDFIETDNGNKKIIERKAHNFDKNILYISRHNGTISNFNNIAYKLSFNITAYQPTVCKCKYKL